MIDLHFFDREGNPIAGKAPTTLHVVSGVGGPATLSRSAGVACRRAFGKFTQAHRLGLYDSLTQRIQIDRNTTLLLQVNQGVFKAVATVTAGPDDSRGYSGIVLQLLRVTAPTFWNDTSAFGDPTGVFPPAVLLPEHDDAQRRFTVPGPLGLDSPLGTNTLIFQIAARGSLSIARGTVKIWRIRSPGVGSVASHDADGVEFDVRNGEAARPIVSADVASGALGPFYLHGQTLPIPGVACGVSAIENSDTPLQFSLMAYGFELVPFTDISEARGVLVFADGSHRLLAYDMGRPQLGWQTLHEIAPPVSFAYEPFGANYEIRGAGGNQVVLSCFGEDRRGALSTWQATLTKRQAGGYNISGSLQRPLEPVEATPPIAYTFSKSASWTNTFTEQTNLNPITGLMERSWCWDLSDNASTSLTQGVGFLPTYEPDEFIGGKDIVGATNAHRFASTTASTSDAFDTDPPTNHIFTPGRDASGTYTISWDVPELNATINFAASYSGGHDLDVNGSNLGSFGSGSSGVGPTSGVAGPHRRTRYRAFDQHRAKYAVRRTCVRAGSWGPSSVPGTNLTNKQYVAAMLACSYDFELVNRSRQPLGSPFNAIAALPGIEHADPYDSTFYGYNNVSVNIWDFGNPFTMPPPSTQVANLTDDVGGAGSLGPVDLGGGNIIVGYDGYFAWLKDYSQSLGVQGNANYLTRTFSTDNADHAVGSFSASVSINGLEQSFQSEGAYEGLGHIDIPNPLNGSNLTETWMRGLDHWSRFFINTTFYGPDIHREPAIVDTDTRVYVDPRTGGCIFQVFIEGERENGQTPAAVKLMIGNEDGFVPLVDVLNDWLAVQNISTRYVDGQIVINRSTAKAVSFI